MSSAEATKASFSVIAISNEALIYLYKLSAGLFTVGETTIVNLENVLFYKGKAILYVSPYDSATTIKSVKIDDTTYTNHEWYDTGVEITPTSTIYVALQ